MQANEIELVALRGPVEEVRISPNFLETDYMNNFTDPFGMEEINDCKGGFTGCNLDDRPVGDIDNDLSFILPCENAVDPYMYINKNDGVPSSAIFHNDNLPSPYSAPNVQIPNWQQSHTVAPPSFIARQESVRNAMEVLSSCTDNNAPNFDHVSYPLTPSPQLGDEDLVEHPSPSFLKQDAQRNRTVSEHALFFPNDFEGEQSRTRSFSFDTVFPGTNHSSFPNKSMLAAAGNETGSTSTNENNQTTASPSQTSSTESEATPCLESLPSFVKESIQNPPRAIHEDSLDVESMLADVINYTPAPLVQPELAKTPPITPVQSPVVTTEEQPCTSVPKLVKSASYKKRRDQNNKACRESRRKRKIKETEAQEKVKELEEDNEELRIKIVRLEEEVEVVRKLVLEKMGGRPNR